MNPTPADYEVIDTRLATIEHPRARAAFERFLLQFIGDHNRFTVLDAARLAWQWGMRVGVATVLEVGKQDWVRFPMPGTLTEWSVDGGMVDPDALPLVLDGVEYHVLYDTVTVNEDTTGTVTWYPEVQPLELPPDTPGYDDFAGHVADRERIMLGHLWHAGMNLEWSADTGDAYSKLEIEGSTRTLFINTDHGDWDVMSLVLRHLAQDLCQLTLGNTSATDVEKGLAGELASMRLGVGTDWVNFAAWEYFKEHTELPAEAGTRWWLILTVAQEIEEILLGEFGARTRPPEEEPASPVDIRQTPLASLGPLLAGLEPEEAFEAAGWVDAFVRANPRFGVEQAVALAWQLWERVGVADRAALRAELIDAELRTIDDWSARGRGSRAGARPLLVPGTHGGTVVYYLAEDVEIVDLSVALDTERFASEEIDHARRHRPPREDTPELSVLDGLVSDYEHALLRNVADRINLLMLALLERGHVRAALSQLAHEIMAREETHGSELEEDLAWLIAAHRLGLPEEPGSLETAEFHHLGIYPPELRWGLVYRVARELEALLRGYSADRMS